MATQTQPRQGETAFLSALAEGAKDVKRERKPRKVHDKVEPRMRALRRILGDDVLDIFPEGFIDTIDGYYIAHSAKEDLWSEVVLDSPEELRDTLILMRAYAECADGNGYTVRQDRDTDPTLLRFRVVPRMTRNSDSDVEADDE